MEKLQQINYMTYMNKKDSVQQMQHRPAVAKATSVGCCGTLGATKKNKKTVTYLSLISL